MTPKGTPEWYPKWAGETVTIVASGPSAVDVNLDKGIGRSWFVAVNRSLKLAPWAGVWYCCDFQWWEEYFKNKALQAEFPYDGLKVCVDFRVKDRLKWGVQYLQCIKGDDRMLLEQPGLVGWGGNSGFNCLNFVAQLKPAKIILVGFDMTKAHGTHWHEPHGKNLSNPTDRNMTRWRRATDFAATVLREAGITVINCSPVSALTRYPKMSYEDALDWQNGQVPRPAPDVTPVGQLGPGDDYLDRMAAAVMVIRQQFPGHVDERVINLLAQQYLNHHDAR